jgi:NADH-quinone oxidoreductase subunit L
MTAGTFAIAGFWPLAGFFSKDEILWQASRVSLVYWGIGVFTAFLTSFYMFRLWFMTFLGEYRGEQGHGDGDSRAGAPAPHGHGGIHESPRLMLVPLVVLAVLSVCGGWVGSARFEKFLSPVFHAGMTAATADKAAASTTLAKREEQGPSEGLLTSISLGAAALGLYLAFLLYYRRPQLPQQIAQALGGFYDTVVHKYYVDEIYAALFVKPLLEGSTRILWQGIDQDVIDSALDNSADGAREVSDSLRRMQSGNIRSYAGWVAAGAAVVIGYMVWMGTR